MIQSSSCLSDVDVRLSQVYLLLSEINQIILKCPEPVQSRQLLPRVDVILSEMTWIVTQSQEDGSAVDGDDSYVSLNWDTYNHSNYYMTVTTTATTTYHLIQRRRMKTT